MLAIAVKISIIDSNLCEFCGVEIAVVGFSACLKLLSDYCRFGHRRVSKHLQSKVRAPAAAL